MHLHSGSKYPCQRRTKSTQYIHSEEGRGKDDWYVSEMEKQGQQGWRTGMLYKEYGTSRK